MFIQMFLTFPFFNEMKYPVSKDIGNQFIPDASRRRTWQENKKNPVTKWGRSCIRQKRNFFTDGEVSRNSKKQGTVTEISFNFHGS